MKICYLLSALIGSVSATTYAQFCNDNACRDGCGQSVSIDNPGCLNQNGRRSIKFHDNNYQSVNLIFSPRPNCPCQNECINIAKGGGFTGAGAAKDGCYNLDGHASAESFRFVEGDATSCMANNC